MLKFINKKGKNVMEVTDEGETKIFNEDLKKSFEAKQMAESAEETVVKNDE